MKNKMYTESLLSPIDYGCNIFKNPQIKGKYNNILKLYEIGSVRKYSYTDQKYNKITSDCPAYYKHCEQHYLYEGLIISKDIIFVYNKLEKYSSIINEIYIESSLSLIKEKTKYISFLMHFTIYYSDDKEINKIKNQLFKDIINFGYFIAVEDTHTFKNDRYAYFAIHPKYILEVTKEIYEGLAIFYHITQAKNLQRIKKNGLIPRNSNTYENYPDRVYLYMSTNPLLLKDKIQQHFNKFKKQKEQQLHQTIIDYNNGKISDKKLKYIIDNRYDYRDYLILKINLKNKKFYNQDDITTQYKLFDDPKSPGIFTYENIDPLCIDIFDKVTIPDTDDFEYIKDYID